MQIADQINALYQQFGQLPGITIEIHRQLIAIGISNRAATATVFLQGAQLSHYQPQGQQPVIWCSPLCDYQQGKSLRGGIPVCWPWFGDLQKNPAAITSQYERLERAPAHGIVREREWGLDSITIVNPSETVLSLSLNLDADSDPFWPFASQLQMELSVGAALNCRLTITNGDHRPFYFSAALHSYLGISDCEQAMVEGLEDCRYIETLNDWSEQRQSGPVLIDRELDRIYGPVPNTIRLKDQTWQRELTLASTGSNSAVVWNPWRDKAKRLSCFADTAYREMLCIETANALDDCVMLKPGLSHCLGVKISHTSLA